MSLSLKKLIIDENHSKQQQSSISEICLQISSPREHKLVVISISHFLTASFFPKLLQQNRRFVSPVLSFVQIELNSLAIIVRALAHNSLLTSFRVGRVQQHSFLIIKRKNLIATVELMHNFTKVQILPIFDIPNFHERPIPPKASALEFSNSHKGSLIGVHIVNIDIVLPLLALHTVSATVSRVFSGLEQNHSVLLRMLHFRDEEFVPHLAASHRLG